jgi:SAM-dependent methyltransferase
MADDPAEVFHRIFRERTWISEESISGWGSELRNTQWIIRELPDFLRRYGVTSILDVPCGDFNWMRYVDLGDIDYTGGDIVPELVEANTAAYGTARRRFARLDLLADPLPQADLIFCRDCLFHFSHADVFRAFEQFARSSARLLLTTTFTWRAWPRNADIVTGQWTPINLEMAPYDLSPPLALLAEGSSESIIYNGEIVVPMADRCLGLWDINAIRERLARRP